MNTTHKCYMCDNVLEETDQGFPEESKNWMRVKIAGTDETRWFCSNECYQKFFDINGALLCNRAQRCAIERAVNKRRKLK